MKSLLTLGLVTFFVVGVVAQAQESIQPSVAATQQKVIFVVDQLLQAEAHQDIGLMEQLLASDYFRVDGAFQRVNRKQIFTAYRQFARQQPQAVIAETHEDDVIRLYDTTAVVNTLVRIKRAGKHQKNLAYCVTYVLVKQNNRWRIGMSHESRVMADAPKAKH